MNTNIINNAVTIPETLYQPTGVCIGDAPLNNTPSGSDLFRSIGGHYTSPAQAIEELVDNAISAIKANGGHL